jgi:hypothetical protein
MGWGVPEAAPRRGCDRAGDRARSVSGRVHLLTVALEDYYQTFPG